MSGIDDRFVLLRDGAIVPAAAYVLLLDLEARGIDVERDGDGLVVSPADRLVDADREGLRRWKHHLWMLLEHGSRVDVDAHLFRDDTPKRAASRDGARRAS